MYVVTMARVASDLVLLRKLLSTDGLQFLLQLRNLLSVQLLLLPHLLLDHSVTIFFFVFIVAKLRLKILDALILTWIVQLGRSCLKVRQLLFESVNLTSFLFVLLQDLVSLLLHLLDVKLQLLL